MAVLPHDLEEEFPDKAELIQRLDGENASFAKLLSKNRTLWKEIQQI
jgi:uncharacterized protein YdcH (DUF465 family)